MARGAVITRVWKDGKTRSYAIKFRDASGRQVLETIGPSKKEAERVLAERMQAVNRGTYKQLQEASFAEFAARWLIDYASPRVKPSTYESYERAVRCHLAPAFETYPLRAITSGAIEDWIGKELAAGQSPKSVNNYIVVLKLMLRHAVAWGYLATNPATDVKRVRVPEREMRALSPEEVRRFLAAVSPDYWLFFATAVFTGLRRGELIAVQWQDVDLDAGQLHVRRSLWRGQYLGPKTKRSVRTVDLAPQLVSAFREARPLVGADTLRSQLVFSNRDGQPLDPDNVMKREFKPALRRAELPDIPFHNLRHTFASLLIASGEHPKAVQSQLGHTSIQTTLDRYGHLLPGAFGHAGARLEETVLEGKALPRS